MNAKVKFDNIEKTNYRNVSSVLQVQSASSEKELKEDVREELKSLSALEALFLSSAK